MWLRAPALRLGIPTYSRSGGRRHVGNLTLITPDRSIVDVALKGPSVFSVKTFTANISLTTVVVNKLSCPIHGSLTPFRFGLSSQEARRGALPRLYGLQWRTRWGIVSHTVNPSAPDL